MQFYRGQEYFVRRHSQNFTTLAHLFCQQTKHDSAFHNSKKSAAVQIYFDVVDSVDKLWNQLLKDLEESAKFYRELKETEESEKSEEAA